MKNCCYTVSLLILTLAVVFLCRGYAESLKRYVTSAYSHYCYSSGMEPRNMMQKNKSYSKDLIGCGKPLKQ